MSPNAERARGAGEKCVSELIRELFVLRGRRRYKTFAEMADALVGCAPHVKELAQSIALLVEQNDRLAALAQLKAIPTLKLGQRQKCVNGLFRELRECKQIDISALASALMAETCSTDLSEAADLREVTVLHIFGDSHTHALAALQCSSHAIFAYPFVAGSAMGLRHADSRSGYRHVLDAGLASVPRAEHVAFKFGQVDVDFVFYLKLVRDPSLSFEAFAADSVSKFMSFVIPALERHRIGRDRFTLLTPHPTVVTDAHLRESLCTLPFMRADFRAQFTAQLDALELPDMATRTRHGRHYCDLLLAEAARHQLHVVDVYDCLLSDHTANGEARKHATACSPNPDAQHHLLPHHLPSILPVFDRSFGGSHTQAAPAPPQASTPSDPTGGLAGGVTAATLQWLQIYNDVTSGKLVLKLHGHVRGSYAQLERRCGKPMRHHKTNEGPLFATWLLRFPQAADGGVLPGAGVVAHVKGRYVLPARSCVWEVEAANADDAVVAIELTQRLVAGVLPGAVAVESLPESARTLHVVQRTSPELFEQLLATQSQKE